MTTADLELSLRRWDGDDYAVDARFRLSVSAAPVQLIGGTPPRVRLDREALLAQQLDSAAYGVELARALFADLRVATALSRAQAQAEALGVPLRLRLRLAPDDDALHAVRWELLHAPDGGGPLARSERILLSRHLDSADLTPLNVGPRAAMRALVVVAAPDPADLARYQLGPINAPAELSRARAALDSLPLTVVASGAGLGATLEATLSALRDGPTIVYLVAHGTLRRGRPYLWLDDDQGRAERVEAIELVEAIARLQRRPLLVMLASCQSAGDDDGAALSALGPQLAAAGVAAVVAMQGNLAMESAERLLPTFFHELWRDGEVDRALAAARLALRASDDWWQPALFLRVPDGRLWRDDAPAQAPEAPAFPPPPQPQRPPDLAGFVGRTAELNAFAKTLAASGVVVLTGMPGVGKTSVASALARTANHPDTTFWHGFRPSEGIDTMVWALAGFLAHQGRPGLWELLHSTRRSGAEPPPPKVLVDYLIQLLDGSDLLLCLDDFHLVDDDPQIEPFVERLRPLMRGGKLRLILTTWRVPAFALAAQVELLAGMVQSDAEQLLAGRGVVLEPQQMAELYTQVGGNAQLLTLAADALRTAQNPARLLADLVEADSIERFLLDAIDAALSAEERDTMKPIAALLEPGGTRAAIEALAEGASVRRPLRSLNDRHLLLTQEAAAGKEYRQHLIVQRFYYEELSRREQAELHRRAATYYEREEPDPLRAVLHHLRAGAQARAAELAVAHWQATLNAGQGRALLALMRLIDVSQLADSLAVALGLARGELATLLRMGDLARANFQQALDLLAAAETSREVRGARARACRGMGELLELEEPQAALEWLRRGLAELGDADAVEEARLQRRLGSALLALGQPSEAEAHLARSLTLLPPAEGPARADVLLNLGVAHCMRGNLRAGGELFSQALELYERAGQRWAALGVRQNLGQVRWITGDWAGAAADYERAITEAMQLGQTLRQTELTLALGMLRARAGDLNAALDLVRASLALAERGSQRLSALSIWSTLADLHLRRGEDVAAGAAVTAAQALAETLGAAEQLAELFRTRSGLLLRAGDLPAALETAERAIDAARAVGDPLGEGLGLRVRGQALAAAGRLPEASESFAQSVALLPDDPYEQARTQAAWGVALAATDRAESQALLTEARTTFTALGARHDLAAIS